MKSSHEKALSKKKGKDSKVNNLVKGLEGKVNDKGEKPKMPYKFQKNEGAKNNDSEEC